MDHDGDDNSPVPPHCISVKSVTDAAANFKGNGLVIAGFVLKGLTADSLFACPKDYVGTTAKPVFNKPSDPTLFALSCQGLYVSQPPSTGEKLRSRKGVGKLVNDVRNRGISKMPCCMAQSQANLVMVMILLLSRQAY